MKKILMGFVGIIATVAIVGTAAYAVLTANASINGIDITSESAVLTIKTGPETYTDNYFVNQTLTVFPGFTFGPQTATLHNGSGPDIDLKVAVQLTAATGDWDALKDKITVTITNGVATPVVKTLSELNAAPVDLPGDPIVSGADQDYGVTLSVDTSAGNEIAGKSITNVTFALTGTQVIP